MKKIKGYKINLRYRDVLRHLKSTAGISDVTPEIEETVRRQIASAAGALRRDPADRARRDDGVQRIVRQAVAVFGFVEMIIGHRAAMPPRHVASKPNCSWRFGPLARLTC